MELLMDDSGLSLNEYILVAVCYIGFFSSSLKTMVFSPDNEILIITSDKSILHAFHIGPAFRARATLALVRKHEIKSCVSIKINDLMKKNEVVLGVLGKATAKMMVKKKLFGKG
jgi:hypothetical protein